MFIYCMYAATELQFLARMHSLGFFLWQTGIAMHANLLKVKWRRGWGRREGPSYAQWTSVALDVQS